MSGDRFPVVPPTFPSFDGGRETMHDDDIAGHVERVRTEGYTLLRKHFPRVLIDAIARACQPIYDASLDTIRTNPNRGPMRHSLELPFAEPFYQSAIHADPVVIRIVKELLGDDADLVQHATDTPAKGSVYQDWHGDIPSLFPEEPTCCPPPPVVAVNHPFVDIGQKNGPFEIAAGTHRMPFDQVVPEIESGLIPYKPLHMRVGDVMIRDPRCVHRGTPNRTDTSRPLAVIVFERSWCCTISRRHSNRMSRHPYDFLSDVEQQLLQRVVERQE